MKSPGIVSHIHRRLVRSIPITVPYIKFCLRSDARRLCLEIKGQVLGVKTVKPQPEKQHELTGAGLLFANFYFSAVSD